MVEKRRGARQRVFRLARSSSAAAQSIAPSGIYRLSASLEGYPDPPLYAPDNMTAPFELVAGDEEREVVGNIVR
jgi:hypothetical protein